MESVMGMQMAQFQTNYTYALMKMSMNDAGESGGGNDRNDVRRAGTRPVQL